MLYAYRQRVYPSQRIAQVCEEQLDFMAVTGLNRPDFHTVSDFRKRHLEALQGLFVPTIHRRIQFILIRLDAVLFCQIRRLSPRVGANLVRGAMQSGIQLQPLHGRAQRLQVAAGL